MNDFSWVLIVTFAFLLCLIFIVSMNSLLFLSYFKISNAHLYKYTLMLNSISNLTLKVQTF